ncbi:MAG: hypothetical protein ACRD0D_12970, partial [Acidimicrobiales bacterium]
MVGAPRRPGRSRGGRLRAARLRSSVLTKVLAALFVALVVSSGVTTVVGARLTRSVLASQAKDRATSQLATLTRVYRDHERNLIMNLRGLGEQLVRNGLTLPERRATLIGELAIWVRNLELDLLWVVSASGAESWPVGTGPAMVRPPPLSTRSAADPTSQIQALVGGNYAQVVPMPVSTGNDLHLIGGSVLQDRVAFDFRARIGDRDDVLVVVD